MLRRLRAIAPDPYTLLAAALIVPAFPPWNQAYLIWFALIPWFAALKRAAGRRQAALQGIWLSFFMSVGGLYWVAVVLHEFGELPWAVAVLGLFLYALAGQLQFPVFAWLFKQMERKRPFLLQTAAGAAFVTAVYTAVDWCVPKLFVDTLGHSLYQARVLRQAADLGGATLLTFLIFCVNDGLWRAFFASGARLRPSLPIGPRGSAAALRARALILPAALFACAWGYGSWREPRIQAAMEHAPTHARFGVIQPNIGDIDKIAAKTGVRAASERVLNTIFGLSEDALALTPRPEILVWPETSYPSSFRTPRTSTELAHDQRVERFVRTTATPLLFGGYDQLGKKDFNAFFFLSPQASSVIPPGGDGAATPPSDLQTYRKNMLLLFGEYIPGAETFTWLRDLFPRVGNFGRGAGPEVLTLSLSGGRSVPIAPIICYEALFPNYVIGGARKGARMVLNITNDSWFGPNGEPELHLSLTTFRTLETRLPMLRATNTGISALIRADGEITEASRIGAAQILNVDVPLTEPIWTLMKAWGDWFGPACFWLAIIATLWLWRRRHLSTA